MNPLWLILITFLSFSSISSDEIHHESQVKKIRSCFENTWGVDPHTSIFLCKYFESALEHENDTDLINDFIIKSEALKIKFPIDIELVRLCEQDGVIQAAKFHPVVFESPYVRIFAGCAESGEREPFHTHMWESIMVIFEDATYFIESNGSNEVLHLKRGVYVLPPEDLYACTNIGASKENCLRFEVKRTYKKL